MQKAAKKAFAKGGALNGANLAIPMIGSTINQVNDWITDLQAAGYGVHIHHVEVSNKESMNRAVGRAIQTGRHIPLNVIKGYAEKPKEVYEQLKKENALEVAFE